MSKDTGISLENIMRYDSNFKSFMRLVDNGKQVYKDQVRKYSKLSHSDGRSKIGYESEENNGLVDFLKGFMEDRGWNEGTLSTKHITNIETFLQRIVLQKQAMISLANPSTIWNYAHKIKQRMDYKLDEFDPYETQIVNVYWLNDFLHGHHATAYFDHLFILGFAKNRGYPQNPFRDPFRAPNVLLRGFKNGSNTYVDVPDDETQMYDTVETEKMRSKRINAIKNFQHVDFTNKILLNNNIRSVHTSNGNHYDGLKTKQEPSLG